MRFNVKSEEQSSSSGAPMLAKGGKRSRPIIWLSMLALALVVALTSHPPVEAAPTIPRFEARPLVRSLTPEAYLVALAKVAPRTAEESDACLKVCKQLWVNGEGWLVRRVSICR